MTPSSSDNDVQHTNKNSAKEKEKLADDMTPPATNKPTVQYQGYKRTITDVVRIRKNLAEGDSAGVSQLMEGIDDAIKTCRNLRRRLERLHRKRNTGYYQILARKSSSKPQ